MTICVVGMGYVGLPLALAFAGKSERVYGLDIDKEKVDKLRKGESYFKTIDNEDVYKAVTSGCLVPTTDVLLLKGVIQLSYAPTPLGKHKEPDTKYIESTMDSIIPYIKGDIGSTGINNIP